ncbi:hypothetical protein AAMO2058_001409000 [Amorphochlora amoebiformis]
MTTRTSSESKTEEIQAPKRKKQRTVKHRLFVRWVCTCSEWILYLLILFLKWCGSKEPTPRHMEKCDDGLFEAACYAIRAMFGTSKYKVLKTRTDKLSLESRVPYGFHQ